MEIRPKLDLQPTLTDNGMCYGCGKNNPIGLKMKFIWDEKTRTARADFQPDANLQGWAGFVHGGLIACILDEAMGWATLLAGAHSVTARMQVRFRQMVKIDSKYIVTCRVTNQNSRLIETEAVITDATGGVYAEGSSTQFIVGPQPGKPVTA